LSITIVIPFCRGFASRSGICVSLKFILLLLLRKFLVKLRKKIALNLIFLRSTAHVCSLGDLAHEPGSARIRLEKVLENTPFLGVTAKVNKG